MDKVYSQIEIDELRRKRFIIVNEMKKIIYNTNGKSAFPVELSYKFREIDDQLQKMGVSLDNPFSSLENEIFHELISNRENSKDYGMYIGRRQGENEVIVVELRSATNKITAQLKVEDFGYVLTGLEKPCSVTIKEQTANKVFVVLREAFEYNGVYPTRAAAEKRIEEIKKEGGGDDYFISEETLEE